LRPTESVHRSIRARTARKEALSIRNFSSGIHLLVPEPGCGEGFTIKNNLKVPPKSPKNPPTMINFRVVFAEKRLDLLRRAIYKLAVCSVRNVRLTFLAIQTFVRAEAHLSCSKGGLLDTCS